MAITFSITTGHVDDDQAPVAYIDPAQPAAFALTIESEQKITLKAPGGDVPGPDEQPLGDPNTYIYVTFPNLLEAADVEALSKQPASGWAFAYFASPFPTLGLMPTADVVIDGKPVTVPLGAVKVSGKPRTGKASVNYYLPRWARDGVAIELPVSAQKPPVAGNKQLKLRVSFDENLVYFTTDPRAPVKNTLRFSISNESSDKIVASSWEEGDRPEFDLCFVYAKNDDDPGYGALTTVGRVTKDTIAVAEIYSHVWTVQPKVAGEVSPHWLLVPDKRVDREVLGVRESASIDFKICDLITELEPGTTLMYLTASIPGYDNHCYTVELKKRRPAAGILHADAHPTIASVGAPVTLTWEPFGVPFAKVSYIENNDEVVQFFPAAVTSCTVKPKARTTYNVIGVNRGDGKGDELGDNWPLDIQVLGPEVTFDLQPKAVYAGDPVTLSWTTKNADKVTIAPGRQGPVEDGPPAGSIVVKPTRDVNAYTVTPMLNGVPGTPIRKIVGIKPKLLFFRTIPAAIRRDVSTQVTLTWAFDDLQTRVSIPFIGDFQSSYNAQARALGRTKYTLVAKSPAPAPEGVDTSTTGEVWLGAYDYNTDVLVRVGASPIAMYMTPPGTYYLPAPKLYVLNGDRTISVIDPASRRVVKTLPIGAPQLGSPLGFYKDRSMDEQGIAPEMVAVVMGRSGSIGNYQWVLLNTRNDSIRETPNGSPKQLRVVTGYGQDGTAVEGDLTTAANAIAAAMYGKPNAVGYVLDPARSSVAFVNYEFE
jgi:hypothetical protein